VTEGTADNADAWNAQASALGALIIQHEDEAPPGHLDAALDAAQIESTVVRVDLGEQLPNPQGFQLIVSLGSDQSVLSADRLEWIPREIVWLREADEAGVPILGLCFGAQILAKALGGDVVCAETPEHGWVELETADPVQIPSGPWLAWHSDTILPPPGSEVIAQTEHSPHAIRIGPHLGTQFHPEATIEIVRGWAAKAPADSDPTPPLIYDDFHAARPRALELFAHFFAHALDSNHDESKVINR
jgi:GMP synthase-like glutamine amidotransferase